MLILPSKELIHIILGYEGEYTLEGNFLIYNQSDTYDACPDCFTRLPETSSCARSWKCANPECQNSGDFEFYSPIYNYSTNTSINIYELAHMCKEWASNNQFTLVSGDSGHGFVCSVGHYSNNAINAEFYGENEFNAVIQGCEWILKETNNATN